MFLETLFTQIKPKTPAVPGRETCIAPKLLRACCVCGFVQDKAGATAGPERWVSQRTYRKTHGVNPTKLALTHAYCPACFEKVQEVMRQSWLKSRSAPYELGGLSIQTRSKTPSSHLP